MIGTASGAATSGASPIGLDSAVAPLASLTAALSAASTPSHARRAKTPKQIAWAMLRDFGWKTPQFKYLDRVWTEESSWNVRAENPYSGAYGIPQAVPGSKMASAGPSWRTDARTQIRWGLGYIKSRYGSPYGAWRHEISYGWY